MSSKLNRHAYEQMIAEDIEWLLKQPRTLEREHIEAVLRCSPDREYARSESVRWNPVDVDAEQPSPMAIGNIVYKKRDDGQWFYCHLTQLPEAK